MASSPLNLPVVMQFSRKLLKASEYCREQSKLNSTILWNSSLVPAFSARCRASTKYWCTEAAAFRDHVHMNPCSLIQKRGRDILKAARSRCSAAKFVLELLTGRPRYPATDRRPKQALLVTRRHTFLPMIWQVVDSAHKMQRG